MPIYGFQQSEPTSCAGAAAMVVLAELECITGLSVELEMNIWETVWSGKPPFESPVANVVTFFRQQRLHSDVYEDDARVNTLKDADAKMSDAWVAHRAQMEARGIAGAEIRIASLVRERFQHDARILLVVLIAKPGPSFGLSHYVLARMEGDRVLIMNPDGASNTDFPMEKLLQWTNGPDPSVMNIGVDKPYIFSGIYVVTTK